MFFVLADFYVEESLLHPHTLNSLDNIISIVTTVCQNVTRSLPPSAKQ